MFCDTWLSLCMLTAVDWNTLLKWVDDDGKPPTPQTPKCMYQEFCIGLIVSLSNWQDWSFLTLQISLYTGCETPPPLVGRTTMVHHDHHHRRSVCKRPARGTHVSGQKNPEIQIVWKGVMLTNIITWQATSALGHSHCWGSLVFFSKKKNNIFCRVLRWWGEGEGLGVTPLITQRVTS